MTTLNGVLMTTLSNSELVNALQNSTSPVVQELCRRLDLLEDDAMFMPAVTRQNLTCRSCLDVLPLEYSEETDSIRYQK